MDEDYAELDRLGFTPARRAKAFAALAETMFAEQYAALDGLRRVCYSVYRRVSGIQNKSTGTFFERAAKKKYGAGFPGEFTEALALAYGSWFPRLRQIRTLTTHGETGTCYLNRETGIISYWHMGSLRSGGKNVDIEDVVEFSNETYHSIVALTEKFFEQFYLSLEPIERHQGCGIYKGRSYERVVPPTPILSFDDGRCWSRAWFENEAGYECPKRDRCAAYHRPASPAEREAYYPRKPQPVSIEKQSNGVFATNATESSTSRDLNEEVS